MKCLPLYGLLGMVIVLGSVEVSRADSGQAPDERRITFGGGRVSFVAPQGFSPLSAEEMKVKFPTANAPRTAVGNPRRTTTIAYDVLDQRVPSTDVNEARKALAGAYEQSLRGLKWVANEVRQVAGREWAYMEFSAAAADQDIHNIVMVGVLDEHPVIFNFNSTVAEFAQVESQLRQSMESIAYTP